MKTSAGKSCNKINLKNSQDCVMRATDELCNRLSVTARI